MATIVVCEDAPEARALLVGCLENQGYRVLPADSLRSLRTILDVEVVDLILLDLGLPDGNGLEAANRLNLGSRAGLIFVTGDDDRNSVIEGLGLGDDYITKPVDPDLLLARVRAVLRRAKLDEPRLSFAGWSIDLMRRALFDPDGSQVALTLGEFNILSALVLARPNALAREVLLDTVSNRDGAASLHVVDTLVSRLRRKMRWQEQEPPILTVRGVGYAVTSE